MHPCRHSSWMIAGMPSLVPSISFACISFASLTPSSGGKFLRRMERLPTVANSKLERSCSSFSSRVILERRSSTRSSTGLLGSS